MSVKKANLAGKVLSVALLLLLTVGFLPFISESYMASAYDSDDPDVNVYNNSYDSFDFTDSEKGFKIVPGSSFSTLCADGYVYDCYQVEGNGNEAVVVRVGSGNNTKLEIPKTISKYGTPMTIVGVISEADLSDKYQYDFEFEEHTAVITKNLVDLVLPETIKFVGRGAFQKFPNLKNVTFRSTGDVIVGTRAFAGCKNLTNLNINSKGKFSAEARAFMDCTSLKTVNLPADNDVSYYAFSGCCNIESISNAPAYVNFGEVDSDVKLKSISFRPGLHHVDGVTADRRVPTDDGGGYTYQDSAFTRLTSVSLPAGITEIGWGAFSGCSNIGTISIPDSVEVIGTRAFYGCTKLNGPTRLPSSITSLEEEAFCGCANLKMNVELPGHIKYLSTAFKESGITGFKWTCDDIHRVELDAFVGCRNLTSINITGCSFYSEDGIQFFDATGSGDNHYPELVMYPAGKNRGGSYTVPDDIMSIYEYAFSSCSLSDIYLPKGWLKFYEAEDLDENDNWVVVSGPFDNMDSKCNIHYIPEYYNDKLDKSFGNSGFANINGSKVSHNWVPYPSMAKGTVFTENGIKYKITAAPGSSIGLVTAIGPKKKTIKTATIPLYAYPDDGYSYKVAGVSKNAFKGCKSLKTVYLGDGQGYFNSPAAIGDYAFAKCPKLTKVVIGEGAKTIGKNAFYKDSRLKSITIKSTNLKKVGKNSLKGISKKAKIYVPSQKYKAYKKLLKGKGQAKTVKILKIK